jgi:hypothetical protein
MRFRAFEEGGYVYIDGNVIKGWHKCGKDEFFANLNPYNNELEGKGLKWCGAPLDKHLMADVLSLVRHYPRTEVMFCLYYNEEEQKWLVHVPKQKGSPAYVSYSDEDYEPPKGYYFSGTIHTHPNMSAFWSGTDTGDQKKKNGLHVVLGLRDGHYNQHLCSIFYNGKQYDQEGCVELPEGELPETNKEWLSSVEEVFEPPKTKSVVSSYYYDMDTYEGDLASLAYNSKFFKNLDRSCSSDYTYYELGETETTEETANYIEEFCFGMSADEQLEVIQILLTRMGEIELSDTVAQRRSDRRSEDEIDASDSGDFTLNLPKGYFEECLTMDK